MTQTLIRKPNVAFCGENPQIFLYAANTISAAASYWYCSYSPHGTGHALMLYHSTECFIYGDNLELAAYLNTMFNRHFDGFSDFDFTVASPQPAIFQRDINPPETYRITCRAPNTEIVLDWLDIRPPEAWMFTDLLDGGFGMKDNEHYDVNNVIFLCGDAKILMNGIALRGEVETATTDARLFSSSAYLALSETWFRTGVS